ncbi:MAG: TonB-dependent receptor [Sphingobacteriaceae bacterium]|nr:MAG: TonB-dependent receptor [Sphingobacteriaceae bacterium]
MKKIYTLIFILFFSAMAFAQQNGSISGNVTTSDGNPAAMVSVAIQSTTYGTMTNENGNYRIGRVKAGTYTLTVSAVGLAPQSKEVTVTAGTSTVVNFTLDINNAQLQEVVIKGKTNTIKTDNPSGSLRLETPLLQLPQNIQSISSVALTQQQITSMSDGVIRNVSGAVRLEHWGDLYTNITSRGSQIQAFRNGFNVVSSWWGPLTEDMSVVDHIEFVKGPAGFLISNGDPSGLYNVVTKKPTGQTKGEVSFTTGSYNLNRATLDLDGKISGDGKLLYRLNLSAQNKGSFRANEFNDRYAFAPVISYQIDDKTKITGEYLYQRAKMSDVGSYYIFSPTGYATQPQNFSPLPAGLAPTIINDHSFTVNFQHQLNDNWKLTAQAARYSYHQDGTSMWADSVNSDGSYYRNVGIWEARSAMSLAQVFLNGKVTTGSVVHKFLGGLDFGDKRYLADYNQTHSLDTGSAPFNPNDVTTRDAPSNGYPVYDRSLSLEARAAAGYGVINSRYSSIYVQDELGFFDNKVRLTLAGRYTYSNQSDAEAKHFTPRVGVSVSIDNSTAVYGLYDQAFTPQTGLVRSGSVNPITGNDLEFGIKKDWADGKWNTTATVYRILKNNELTQDPLDSTRRYSIVFGQRRARGIEFDLRGEILPGLQLTANYALTDSRVSKVEKAVSDSTGINVGDINPGYAKHVANAWLTYKLLSGGLKGTGISAGFTYLADRQTDGWSEGLQHLPNYFKLDGGLFWEGSKVRVTANAFNILNKYLYSGSYYVFAYTYQAEAPRNYRLSVNYRF